jgi:hypothetical protein
MENTQDKNKYYFQGMRFIPGYNDFDADDYEIEASNEQEAWDLLFKHTKKFTWKAVGLVSINGVNVKVA